MYSVLVFFSIKDNKKNVTNFNVIIKRDFPNIDINGWGQTIENKYAEVRHPVD